MSSAGSPKNPTTFAELADELETEALNFWEAAKGKIIQIEGAAVNAAVHIAAELKPVVEADLVALFSQLKTVAFNTIGSLATMEFSNLTGAQKNSITANTVVQAAIASGKTIALQDAQKLAQDAFNVLAANKPN